MTHGRGHRSRRGALCALPLIASLAGGCWLDASDLDAFRSTATGPDKLRAVLRDVASPSSLRAMAALNLLDLERKDVDGRAALFEELATLDARGRGQIVPTFESGLVLRMKTPLGSEPSASALRAKDAGVELLPMLGTTERVSLGAELLRWITADVELRADRGVYSLEAVAQRIGPGCAPVLSDALRPELTQKSLARVLDVIDQHADAGARAGAAVRIVEVERAYREPAHRHVIEKQLRREGALSEATEASLLDAQIDARRRDTLAMLLAALGRFSDQPRARARLLEIAREPGLSRDERNLAFSLLTGRTQTDDLDALLKLALDDKEPIELREQALARAGETGSRDVVPTLLTLVTDRPHQSLRQRAGELLIEIGGAQSLQAFLRSLPRQWDMTYAKSEIDAYSERVSRLPPETPLVLMLGEKLHSVFWWNRVIALRYFAARGIAEDLWRIRQHVRDEQLITGEGWPEAYTVGHEAEAALAIAMERFRKAKAAAPANAEAGPISPP